MPDDKFRLPKSSYPELEKILQGYAHFGEKPVQLDEIANVVGIGRNQVSQNHGFLLDTGLITGGHTKQASPLCIKLGRALQFGIEKDIQETLQEVVQNTEFLANVVTTVRIKNGMDAEELRKHILYTAGASQDKNTSAGAGAVIEILSASGLLVENNGKLVVATPQIYGEKDSSIPTSTDETEKTEQVIEDAAATPPIKKLASYIPSININIELHLPESHDVDVYDKLFLSLKKHLLTPDDD